MQAARQNALRSPAAIALVVLWVVAAEGAVSWVPDAWLTLKVKVALLTADELDAGEVQVDTIDGRVALHGTIPSIEERLRAVQAARGVDGVRDVLDLLQVVEPSRRGAVRVADEALRGLVEKALATRLPVEARNDFVVLSVSDGVVLLAGEADAREDVLTALRVVRGLQGVRRVVSEIRLDESAKRRAGLLDRRELQAGDRNLIDVAGEVWRTAAVRLRLLADPAVPALDVNVDTRGRDVTLFGIVSSEKARARAGELARAVDGVRRVENKLEVVSEARRAVVAVKDEELAAAVREELSGRPGLKGAVLSVAVKNGVVRLTGTARGREQILLAAIAARRVPGVRAVEQDVAVLELTREVAAPRDEG